MSALTELSQSPRKSRKWRDALLLGQHYGAVPGRLVPFLSAHRNDDLEAVKGLIEAGKVTPVVDRTFALEATADDIRYVEAGDARGKVIITI